MMYGIFMCIALSFFFQAVVNSLKLNNKCKTVTVILLYCFGLITSSYLPIFSFPGFSLIFRTQWFVSAVVEVIVEIDASLQFLFILILT